jgi:7-cyano-7-deazaguanine reductase
MARKNLEGLTELGKGKTKYRFNNPDKRMLESFENQHPELDYVISFKCPEFTSLCPKTGQPDFGTIYIQYIPDKQCLESKSLKLYLFAFRNFGEFHEDCVCRIMKDITAKIQPRWIRVEGQFRPRGGISIVPAAEYAKEGYSVPAYAAKRIEHELNK